MRFFVIGSIRLLLSLSCSDKPQLFIQDLELLFHHPSASENLIWGFKLQTSAHFCLHYCALTVTHTFAHSCFFPILVHHCWPKFCALHNCSNFFTQLSHTASAIANYCSHFCTALPSNYHLKPYSSTGLRCTAQDGRTRLPIKTPVLVYEGSVLILSILSQGNPNDPNFGGRDPKPH